MKAVLREVTTERIQRVMQLVRVEAVQTRESLQKLTNLNEEQMTLLSTRLSCTSEVEDLKVQLRYSIRDCGSS